jgi:hypothetical protein
MTTAGGRATAALERNATRYLQTPAKRTLAPTTSSGLTTSSPGWIRTTKN